MILTKLIFYEIITKIAICLRELGKEVKEIKAYENIPIRFTYQL